VSFSTVSTRLSCVGHQERNATDCLTGCILQPGVRCAAAESPNKRNDSNEAPQPFSSLRGTRSSKGISSCSCGVVNSFKNAKNLFGCSLYKALYTRHDRTHLLDRAHYMGCPALAVNRGWPVIWYFSVSNS
jgi:hypothetical protein